jgi:hypothetical protein
MCESSNEVTSADGGWRVLFVFVAQWPTAELFRYASGNGPFFL